MISAISSVRPFGGPAATSGVGPAASGASGAGGDFTKVLADVASSTVGALKTGESTATTTTAAAQQRSRALSRIRGMAPSPTFIPTQRYIILI
jgi:hypothetical protein